MYLGRGAPDHGVRPFAVFTEPLLRVAVEVEFIVRALDPSASGHDEASAFLAHLDLSGCDIFRSELLDVELHDVAFGRGRWSGRSGVRRFDVAAATMFLDAWHALVESTRLHVVPTEDCVVDLTDLMSAFDIDALRAIQTSAALAAGAQALVTVDPAYARVSADALSLLVDGGSLSAARALRAA